MAGNLSLESAIKTCKINAGYADKMYSDRYFNPSQMVCPAWTGYDLTGRSVCADTFNTKSAGCNSSLDRITVENRIARPRYFEYVTLNTDGVEGNIYGSGTRGAQALAAKQEVDSANSYTGNFGIQFGSVLRSNCGSATPYKLGMGYQR